MSGLMDMKKNYNPAELEIIELAVCDIVTASSSDNSDDNPGGPFGGGYDASGWT